jgi:hypothetical protein
MWPMREGPDHDSVLLWGSALPIPVFVERRTTVASLSVTVAAYHSFETASADWDELARCPADVLGLIDAALIERCDHRVAALHRFSSTGWAQGSVASALVGRLSPPALLDGAIAGGVGRRALTFVSSGLSLEAVNELGRVMGSGRFVTVAVVESGPDPATAACGARTLGVATQPMRGNAIDLRHAVEADETDE